MRQNRPKTPRDSDKSPLDLARVREIKNLLSLFGSPKPERVDFHAGDILIQEGQRLENQPALLVMQGKLEERKTMVVEGHGMCEQVFAIIREGDITNEIGILDTEDEKVSAKSIHAVETGYGYALYPEHIKNLDSLGILLQSLLRKSSKQWEAFFQTSNGFSQFYLLLQDLKPKFPKLPQLPADFLRLLQKAVTERDSLARNAKHHESQMLAISMRLTELENANTALKRDLNLERKLRKALEKKNSELLQQIANSSSSGVSSAKFPSAAHLLESDELSELETNAKRFREAASHFEELANKMHRALELLAEDNPGMIVSEDVMQLMVGEEPPARSSVEKAKARRDSAEFKTVHMGSMSPEKALRRERRTPPMDLSRSKKPDDTAPKSLSDKDISEILQEFVSENPGTNEAHSEKEFPKSRTRPFIPDSDHPATNSEVDIPQAPPTPRANFDGFTETEADSDITPIVVEYPPVSFPDEGSDVIEIQEDWRNALNGKITPEPPVVHAAEADEDDDAPILDDDIDWLGTDTTETYSSPGTLIEDASFKPDSNRQTRSYDFPAPGKPPKPKS